MLLQNGNIGVLKSMVSELTIDHLPHQRAQAFSLLPLMYGLGSIIGPILGGFLSHPVENIPIVFGNLGFITDFLRNYPYFLPCFISAMICVCGLIFGFFFLQETHNVHYDEEENLLTTDNEQQHNYSTFKNNAKVQHSPTPTIQDKPTPPTLKEALTPSVVAICIAYGLFSLQAVFMDGKYIHFFSHVKLITSMLELFPLYTASSRNNGGLGFTPNEIGIALSYAGIVTLIGQIFVLPTLTKKFGLLRLFQIVLSVVIFLYLFQGIIRLLYLVPDPQGQVDTKFWVWVGVLFSLTIKTIGHTICFTSCTILVNNACPRVDALGAVNGFSQCKKKKKKQAK